MLRNAFSWRRHKLRSMNNGLSLLDIIHYNAICSTVGIK